MGNKRQHLLQPSVSKSWSLLANLEVNVGLLQSSGLSLTSHPAHLLWVTSATPKGSALTSASVTPISTFPTPHISPELQVPVSNYPRDRPPSYPIDGSTSNSFLFPKPQFFSLNLSIAVVL